MRYKVYTTFLGGTIAYDTENNTYHLYNPDLKAFKKQPTTKEELLKIYNQYKKANVINRPGITHVIEHLFKKGCSHLTVEETELDNIQFK